MDFENKVAVITGAGAGIGQAIALRCADRGADIAVVDINENRAKDTVNMVEDRDQKAIQIHADISDNAEVEAIAEEVEAKFGRADILVNNAGIRINGPVTEKDLEDWHRILDVNLLGVGLTSKYLIPLMEQSGGGSIVNVSSCNAVVPREGMPLYDATKAGVLGLTRAMACDHANQGIRVNAVLPGPTFTDFHKERLNRKASEMTTRHENGPGILKRWAEPEELANAVCFLASNDASYITAAEIRVDGGVDAVSYTARPN